MIIEGNPELGLQKHQQDAYKSVKKAYETRNKASVVIPTGCGKSFIALQLMADNKDKRILFMAPTNAIKNQMYNYIAKYIANEEPTSERTSRMIADEYFPNLKIMLYPSLLKVKEEQMEKLNADIIIMDELHRTGADKWGQRINTLLEKNSNAQILGLTATPDRMDDKNVVDELFEGNVDYELTLVDALKNGIVKAPTYVKCDYTLGEYLEGIRTAIANCNDEQKKKELQDRNDKMRKIVDQADGIPELFAKNIKKKDGKYIIFCKDKEHMDELMVKAKEWFGEVDTEPELYSVYSGEGYSEKDNKESIKRFENSKSEHIKLLFSIEMLNEGLHVEDISGVIMARPTDSRIIYLQQLGRALSSDISRDKTIVFDLVNNYLKNNLDIEINRRTNRTRNVEGGHIDIGSGDENTDIEDIDIFRIQGETKEFLELLEEVQEIIGHNEHLVNARYIKKWMEDRESIKPPAISSNDYNEKRLGIALSNIRQKLIKPYSQLESEEDKAQFIAEHPELQEILQIVNWIDENNISPYLANARQIKAWMEENNTTKPPRSQNGDATEKRLGKALSTIRQKFIKPYLQLETEDEKIKFENEHPELRETLQIVNWIDEKNISPNLSNAIQIQEWMKDHTTTKPPSAASRDEVERRLGLALTEIRRNIINPYKKLQTEEEKNEFETKHPELQEVMRIIDEIDKNNISPNLNNIREIKKWMEQRKTIKPPTSNSKEDEEQRLGRALQYIRQTLIKSYNDLQTDEEREQFQNEHPELQEILSIVSWIDKNNISPYLINARNIKIWVQQNQFVKLPSRSSKADETEKDLARKLGNIRQDLIKPYMILQTEEERSEYREKHSELDEVLSIISELDVQCGNKKQRELAILISQDLEKRRTLQEAKKLEHKYEQQLLMEKGQETGNTLEQGVDFDE